MDSRRINKDGEVIFESLIENTLGERILEKFEEISLNQTLIRCTNVGAYLKDTVPESEAQIVRNAYQTVIVMKDFKVIKEPFVKITAHNPLGKRYDTLKKMEEFQKKVYLVESEDTMAGRKRKRCLKTRRASISGGSILKIFSMSM